VSGTKKKNRAMTNRRMFVTMLLGSMFRRRSRVLAAVLSSAVGAATTIGLSVVLTVLIVAATARVLDRSDTRC